jgi:transcription elongation factor GreA
MPEGSLMSQRIPMTPAGHAMLTVELRRLKEHERLKIVRDIEEARAQGDISENSEYEDAKHRQSLCEGRIMELEGKLAAAEIIDVSKLQPSDRVVFGVTVVVEDQETGEEARYRVVGVDEADVKAGLISVSSPIGRALVGKREGDEVTFQSPRGQRRFSITQVLYK